MITPVLRYRDARAAIDWLGAAFGLEPVAVHEGPDGSVAHAELRLGDGIVVLGQVRDAAATAYDAVAPPPGTAALYAVVEDPDAHHRRAAAAGADVVEPPVDRAYGAREYLARDLDGNLWSFGTYVPAALGRA
ncbi:MAG TPA: VOC family protein [Capillimicrobium sp.]|nr:VOC family protein [Capillimicrobium sp.]